MRRWTEAPWARKSRSISTLLHVAARCYEVVSKGTSCWNNVAPDPECVGAKISRACSGYRPAGTLLRSVWFAGVPCRRDASLSKIKTMVLGSLRLPAELQFDITRYSHRSKYRLNYSGMLNRHTAGASRTMSGDRYGEREWRDCTYHWGAALVVCVIQQPARLAPNDVPCFLQVALLNGVSESR